MFESAKEPPFIRTVTLADGRSVRLRWIQPDDTELIREGMTRLSPRSRQMRFFAALRELPDATLQSMTHVDGRNHVAIVATTQVSDGTTDAERGLGIARFVRSPECAREAELAITVTDDTQGLGLGHALLRAIATAARERNVDSFTMCVLAENTRVRSALRRLGAVWKGIDGDVSSYALRVAALSPETHLRPAA
jgi:acetyltransferase